jgi:ribose transport system substrate-binding protein
MALGMIEALERGGRKIPIVGVNAIPEAVTAIKAGKLLATADFNAMSMSAIATEAAIRHMNGERVPAEIILPAQVVDHTNCTQWDTPFEERALPRWEDTTR